MTFGLMSFGHSLGQKLAIEDVAAEYTDDVERVLSFGNRHVHRAPADVGITDLSYDAVTRALDAAGVEPSEVDLLVLSVTDLVEYLYWDAAASLLHRLGCGRAEAVLLTQACSYGVAAFDIVAGKFATHPEYRTAVIVAASRVVEPYWNRMKTQAGVMSDGAVATVARRDHSRLRWRATEVTTDGEFADFFRLDVGGSVAPFGAPGVPAGSPHVKDINYVREYFNDDHDRVMAFLALTNTKYREVTERACKNAGVDISAIDRLVLPHDNHRTVTAVAEALGVPQERTNLELAMEHSHLGAADPIFSLACHDTDGDLVDGQLVALAAIGRGMSWACTLVEV